MIGYLVQRLLLSLVALVGTTLIVFILVRLAPGDAAMISATEAGGMAQYIPDAEAVAALRAELGIDRPAVVQYVVWWRDVLRGDFGRSFSTREPTIIVLRKSIPPSIELAVFAMAMAIAAGIPAGILSAMYRDTWIDLGSRAWGISGLSIPNFFVATLVIILPARFLGWSPPIPYVSVREDLVDGLLLIVPAAAVLGWALSATITRMTRSMLLEVLGQDYIRTARAKGLTTRAVIWGHALKNALIPVVTIIGLQVGGLIGGSVIIESIYSIPGVGKLTIEAIRNRDYAQMQANIVFLAGVVIVANLVTDLSYAWLDPRIRYERSGR